MVPAIVGLDGPVPLPCAATTTGMATGLTGSLMLGSMVRTSRIRSAETAARGTRMNMKTAIRTAIRICIR